MIIDIRCRPPIEEVVRAVKKRTPLKSYFDMGLGIEPESFAQRSVELLLKEMDEAGVSKAVFIGRIRKGFEVPNDAIADIVEKYPDRFIGVGGIDVWKEYHEPMSEIERCIKHLKFKGISIEPGGLGKPMHFNDPRLYPIYAKCGELGVPVFITTGPKQGPGLDFTRPEHIEPVANEFSDLKIMMIHGCYPYIMEMIGVALRCPNVFFSSDIYTFWPGGKMYIEAAESKLDNKMIFGSAYPISPVKESVEAFKSFSMKPEVLEKIFSGNAAKLISL